MDYEYTAPRPASAQLTDEINTDPAISATAAGISWSAPDRLIVSMSATLSGAEKAALDAVVAGHELSLDTLKSQLVASIKRYRNYLLEAVRTIEHPAASGKFFGVSFVDQQNWHGLYTARTFASYPMTIRTKDELQEHSIADQSEVETLFGLVFGTVNAEISAARTAIGGVMDAVDAASAQAAHDAYVPGA